MSCAGPWSFQGKIYKCSPFNEKEQQSLPTRHSNYSYELHVVYKLSHTVPYIFIITRGRRGMLFIAAWEILYYISHIVDVQTVATIARRADDIQTVVHVRSK